MGAPTTVPQLRARREAAGLTREQLAVYAGTSARTVQRTEVGRTIPRLSTLIAIAAVLDCSAADLLQDNGAPPQGAEVTADAPLDQEERDDEP